MALFLVGACTSLQVRLIKTHEVISADKGMPWRHTDLMPAWMGSRMVLRGQNPYSADATRLIQSAYYGRPLTATEDRESKINRMGFAYPAQTAIIFIWLAKLSWPAACWTFLLLSPLLMVASVLMWMYVCGSPFNVRYATFAIASVIVSWPFLWGLRLQNLTLLVVPIISAGCLLLLKGRTALAGFLLAMTTAKPQLVCLLLAWLILWAIVNRSWSFVSSFAATIAGLLFISFLLLPEWIIGWRSSMNDYVTYTHVMPELPLVFEVLLIAFTFAALWKLRKSQLGSPDFRLAIGLALSSTVALMPINWPTSYNYLLLIPAYLTLITAKAVESFSHLLRQIALGFLILEFLLPLVAMTWEHFRGLTPMTAALCGSNFLLPISVCVALITYQFTKERQAIASYDAAIL